MKRRVLPRRAGKTPTQGKKFWSQGKRRFAKRAGIAALALGTTFGANSAASALEARADSAQAGARKAKPTFVAGAAGWRAPLGKQSNAGLETFLVDRQVPVYLDFSRAKGSSNFSLLAVAGRKGIGMHFLYSKELQAKDVPAFINLGLKGKIGPMIAGLSAVGGGGKYKPEASASFSSGPFGFEGSKKPTTSEPMRLGVSSFREIGSSKLSAFLKANFSKSALPSGGLSLDRHTRAFDLSIGPENTRAVAIIQAIGPKKYVSLIYSQGSEKRVMLEIFAMR